ncbi:hypothetical protein RJ641_007347 [Dillenia turbinata]|uniref:Uncharacterized protein n=1 Tax=Dillenia turbinata TaxID=194707 RepID=A0AAN8UZ28_9MAGN
MVPGCRDHVEQAHPDDLCSTYLHSLVLPYVSALLQRGNVFRPLSFNSMHSAHQQAEHLSCGDGRLCPSRIPLVRAASHMYFMSTVYKLDIYLQLYGMLDRRLRTRFELSSECGVGQIFAAVMLYLFSVKVRILHVAKVAKVINIYEYQSSISVIGLYVTAFARRNFDVCSVVISITFAIFRGQRTRSTMKSEGDHQGNKKKEATMDIHSADSSTTTSSNDSPKIERIDFECMEVSSNGCSTPKGKRFRIPEIGTCPPAPKKRRLVWTCSAERSPIAFFAPPHRM